MQIQIQLVSIEAQVLDVQFKAWGAVVNARCLSQVAVLVKFQDVQMMVNAILVHIAHLVVV